MARKTSRAPQAARTQRSPRARNRAAQPHPASGGISVQPVRNGLGMVARRAFASGALICRIHGTILTSAAVWRAWATAPRVAANCYRFDAERYLSPKGHVADFSNHSCRPNAMVRCEGRGLVLRALRPIAAGDEITHDYSTLLGADDVWTMRCNCGERACRGVVRRFDRLPGPLIAQYLRLGAIPAHILATAGRSDVNIPERRAPQRSQRQTPRRSPNHGAASGAAPGSAPGAAPIAAPGAAPVAAPGAALRARRAAPSPRRVTP